MGARADARREVNELSDKYPDLSWAAFEQRVVRSGVKRDTADFYEDVLSEAFYELHLEGAL